MPIRVVIMINHVTPSIIWSLSSCHPPIARLNVCWWQIVWVTLNKMFSVVHLPLDKSYWSAYWHLWNIDHRIFTTDYFLTSHSLFACPWHIKRHLDNLITSKSYHNRHFWPVYISIQKHYILGKILFPLRPMTKAFKTSLTTSCGCGFELPTMTTRNSRSFFFLTGLWSRVQ